MTSSYIEGEQGSLPRHIGIIMDGNGRWATRRGLPRNAGHKKGSSTFEKIVDRASKIGVKHLTVYTLSTENIIKRPKEEVDGIMDLLRSYLKDRRKNQNESVRTLFIGDIKGLPKDIQLSITEMEKNTKDNEGMVLNLAINYGGRPEILQAVKQIAVNVQNGILSLDALDETLFSEYLYTAGQPEVDLIIRTGGDLRTSNFLIWQAAYAELYSTETLWPDFTPKDFDKALEEYALRNRRMGGI